MSVWVYKRHGISPQECACTGKEFYASLDYIKHNHFPQCLWNDICLTSTFQKNHTCICIVCSWYLNQPPFEHHISYFLLMPQKSLIYNSSNFFLKKKKTKLSVIPDTSHWVSQASSLQKTYFWQKNSYTSDQCMPEPTFNLVKVCISAMKSSTSPTYCLMHSIAAVPH